MLNIWQLLSKKGHTKPLSRLVGWMIMNAHCTCGSRMLVWSRTCNVNRSLHPNDKWIPWKRKHQNPNVGCNDILKMRQQLKHALQQLHCSTKSVVDVRGAQICCDNNMMISWEKVTHTSDRALFVILSHNHAMVANIFNCCKNLDPEHICCQCVMQWQEVGCDRLHKQKKTMGSKMRIALQQWRNYKTFEILVENKHLHIATVFCEFAVFNQWNQQDAAWNICLTNHLFQHLLCLTLSKDVKRGSFKHLTNVSLHLLVFDFAAESKCQNWWSLCQNWSEQNAIDAIHCNSEAETNFQCPLTTGSGWCKLLSVNAVIKMVTS